MPAHQSDIPADEDFQLLAHLESGRAIIGEAQFLPGYSLLLSGVPGVDRLTDLPRSARVAFLADMEAVGEAVERVCQRDSDFRRINLEIQGNLTPKLHAHIWPRYEWEPAAVRFHQVARHPKERWHDPATRLGPQHTPLRDALRAELAIVVKQNQSMPNG
ncbi:diadenosine tetraphosphate hydrolase [Microlunatus sp. GCM10028923]|uniref:diadenosine tetraphosphate hydrolase n=1 Tax=Microlunatus sp. GCM10028923 TaxID=3273400 RepID=UPI003623DE1F